MTIEELDRLMETAAHNRLIVHAVDFDGIEYEGVACHYCEPDNNEDGFASFCIRDPEININLSSNELKHLEIISAGRT